jgi:hypothetical protein
MTLTLLVVMVMVVVIESVVAVAVVVVVVRLLVLLGLAVDTNDNGVVALVRLECELLLWSHLLSLHLVNLGGKHLLWCGGRVDTACLESHDGNGGGGGKEERA